MSKAALATTSPAAEPETELLRTAGATTRDPLAELRYFEDVIISAHPIPEARNLLLRGLERAEASAPIAAAWADAFGWPRSWRRRERDWLICHLAASGLSRVQIAALLLRPCGPFAAVAKKILRLNDGKPLCPQRIGRIVSE